MSTLNAVQAELRPGPSTTKSMSLGLLPNMSRVRGECRNAIKPCRRIRLAVAKQECDKNPNARQQKPVTRNLGSTEIDSP